MNGLEEFEKAVLLKDFNESTQQIHRMVEEVARQAFLKRTPPETIYLSVREAFRDKPTQILCPHGQMAAAAVTVLVIDRIAAGKEKGAGNGNG